MRPTAPRLDGTMAFMVWFCFFFLAILIGDLIRDNPVYHVLILPCLTPVSRRVMHTCYTNIKKPATGFIGGRLLRIGTREDFLQRNERVTVRMDFSLCHGDCVRINEQG